MRIAFLSMYSGDINRGVESWVHELATQLTEFGHEVTVYQRDDNPSAMYRISTVALDVDWESPDMSDTGVREYDLDYWSTLLGKFAFGVLPDLLKWKPDIVMPQNGSWQTAVAKRYCEFSGAKLALVGHWDDKNSLGFNPDLYCPTSDRQAEWAQNFFAGDIQTIYPAVDTNRFTPEGSSYSLSVVPPRILTVGALNEMKRIDLVIDAVAMLPTASLVVCGEGGMKEELQKKGKKLLGDRFELLALSPEEMPSLYRACDVFTLVSDSYEAFGLVFVEALATGLPVVARDDSVRRHIVGDAGVLIEDPDDSSAYASVLQSVLSTDFGDRPRQQAGRFSWEVTAKEYERALLTVIEK